MGISGIAHPVTTAGMVKLVRMVRMAIASARERVVIQGQVAVVVAPSGWTQGLQVKVVSEAKAAMAVTVALVRADQAGVPVVVAAVVGRTIRTTNRSTATVAREVPAARGVWVASLPVMVTRGAMVALVKAMPSPRRSGMGLLDFPVAVEEVGAGQVVVRPASVEHFS